MTTHKNQSTFAPQMKTYFCYLFLSEREKEKRKMEQIFWFCDFDVKRKADLINKRKICHA